MFVKHLIHGISFAASISDKVCLVNQDDFTAKSFLMKSLENAQFNGYHYKYVCWNNYRQLNWYGGLLYDRYSIVCLDDADLYIQSLLSIIGSIKCVIIVIASAPTLSMIKREIRTAVDYEVRSGEASLSLNPKPRICAYCGSEFPASQLTVDHIIPQSFCNKYMPGASIKEHYANRLMCCFSCNRDKSENILIPDYTRRGWMRFMTDEQRGKYSDIFVQLLQAEYDNVVEWIYWKNMRSRSYSYVSWQQASEQIEADIKFFLERYLDRKPGEYWALI